MLLNMQMADRLRATGDTTNVLFDRLKEAGYEEGGEVQDSLMGMMYGGMANKKKKGYQDGGEVMDLITTLLSGVGGGLGGGVGKFMARRALAKRNAGDIKSDMPLIEGQIDAPMIDMDAVLARKKMQDDASFSIVPVVGEFKGTRIYQGSPEMESYLDSGAHQEYIKRKFAQMKSPKVTPFQDGGPIGPPLPPEMMGQAMNQQLSDSIDMRMQNPQAGGSIGVARNQAMALQDSINMNTVDSARKSLQLLRLQSLLSEGGDTLNFEGSMMPPNQEMESARARDLLEFLKMQTMQRGMGSVKQGMGDEPMRALR